jgi:predicted amidohydrolase YtcJ
MRRRDFIKYTAALGTFAASEPASALAAQVASGPSAAAAPSGGDLAIVNAKIVTLDTARPRAEAALVRGGRIALVGTTQDVRAAAGRARMFDAAGRTVVPGFVDAHCHMEVATSAASYMVSVHTPPHTSLAGITDTLRKRVAATPKGGWIIGRGSFNLQNNVAEKRLFTREDLDAISMDHPIVIFSGRHVTMANTAGFKGLHLWERDSPMERGTIVYRDEAGVPTGLATEVYYHLPAYSVEEVKTAIKTHVVDMFTSKGTTTIYSVPFSANDIRANLELQRAGQLPLRIRNYYHVPHTINFEGLLGMGMISGAGNDMWRFGGMKLFVDGLGGDGRGNRMADLKWTQEELNHMVSRSTAEGMQVWMHIASDEAEKMAVAAVAEARRHTSRPIIHRIEHGASRGSLEEIRRLRDLGIRPSITPNRGRPGSQGGPRYRTLVREGYHPVVVTDTTGTTPGSSDILFKLACIATPFEEGGGAQREETLPFEEALRLFTLSNAKTNYEDADKGSIEVGKLGDFAVLSRDPTAGSPAQLFDTKVEATILGGTVVYEK